MKKRFLTAGIVGLMAIGAASIYAAAEMPGDKKVINFGPGPLTEEQIRDRLTAAGFSNIQIGPRRIIAAVAMRNGRSLERAIDPQSGKVIRSSGDNDGDDDD
jgi:hypothetical protein